MSDEDDPGLVKVRLRSWMGEEIEEAIRLFEEQVGAPRVAVLVLVRDHEHELMPMIEADASEVYLATGLLEQAKLELLASVPINRPLREPEPTDEDLAPAPKPKSEIN